MKENRKSNSKPIDAWWLGTKGRNGTIGQQKNTNEKTVSIIKWDKMLNLLYSLFSLDWLLNNIANRSGITKISMVYFTAMANPKNNEYKMSLVLEYSLPIASPKEIINTDSPNRMLLGETWSTNKKPAGKSNKVTSKTKLDEKGCLDISLEPIYIKIRFKNNKPALEINMISSTVSVRSNILIKKAEK